MSNDKTETENLPATQADRSLAVADDAEAMKLLQEAGSTNDFTAGDLVVPWLSLVQTTGGYMKRNNANYNPDAKEGDITDNLTRRLRSHQAVILCRFETHYTTWGPDGGKLVKQWFQDASGYNAAKFPVSKKDGKPMTFGKKIDADGNIVQPVNVYYILAVDLETGVFTPMTLGLASTQFSKAKKVNSLAREMMVVDGKPFIPPIFARIFDVTSNIESGGEDGNKSWAGWVFNPGASVLSHKFGKLWFSAAKQFREEVLAGRVRPQAPEDAGEAAAPPPRDDDDDGYADGKYQNVQTGGSRSAPDGEEIPF